MDGANEARQENSSLSPGEKLKTEIMNFCQRIQMSFAHVISLERGILKFLSVTQPRGFGQGDHLLIPLRCILNK
jgi:hypothetical protein